MTTDSSRLPLGKRILFWLILMAIPLLAIELGLRTYFAYQLGSSLLFYGTRLNREKCGDARSGDMNLLEGYFKYHPHEKRFTRDKESGRLIRVTINGSGFRGHEFVERKDPHIMRVITLGASSTFGFSDRDDETYPYYLEQVLNREAPLGCRFEVMNFGIPHLTSDQILTLVETEVFNYHPDVVTFYEGANDTWRSRILLKKTSRGPGTVRTRLRRYSLLHRGFTWLRDHLIAIVIADGYIKKRRNAGFTPSDIAEHMQGKGEGFVSNVSAIYEECRRRGITFIVGIQQAQSLTLDRKHRKGVTYDEEVNLVRRKLAQNGTINDMQLTFLTHATLMHYLRNWCDADEVPYADIIAAMNQRRDCLVSWVHLNAEGNRIVAEAFAEAILNQIGVEQAVHAHAKPPMTPQN